MLLFLDIETGGIGLDKSILTAYFLVTKNDLTVVDDVYFLLKPDDEIYRVTGEALNINKINLEQHSLAAISYKKVGSLLYNFLKRNSYDGKIKLIPVGHGVKFDIFHLVEGGVINRKTWDNFVSYRCLDTQSICQFLILINKIDGNKTTGSLESLVDLFKIKTITEPRSEEVRNLTFHNAMDDVLASREVLRNFMSICNFINL